MRMILVGVLVVASSGLATAQSVQMTGRVAVIAASTTGATVEFDRAERRDDAIYVQNLTVPIGDLAMTADDATLEKTEIKLGANARVGLPKAESTQATNRRAT